MLVCGGPVPIRGERNRGGGNGVAKGGVVLCQRGGTGKGREVQGGEKRGQEVTL